MDIIEQQYMTALEVKDKQIRDLEWHIKIARTDIKKLLEVIQSISLDREEV